MNPKPSGWHELVDMVAIENEREYFRRQLRELEAQREAGAVEINRLHKEIVARDGRIAALIAALEAENHELFSRALRRQERIAALETDAVYAGRAIEHYQSEVVRVEAERSTARRAAAARLRAVKRMKRVARHYQLLALRLAVGAELYGVAEAERRTAGTG